MPFRPPAAAPARRPAGRRVGVPGRVQASGGDPGPRARRVELRGIQAGRAADPARDQTLPLVVEFDEVGELRHAVQRAARWPCCRSPTKCRSPGRRAQPGQAGRSRWSCCVRLPPVPVPSRAAAACARSAPSPSTRRRPAWVQNCRVDDRRIRPGDAHRAGCAPGAVTGRPQGALGSLSTAQPLTASAPSVRTPSAPTMYGGDTCSRGAPPASSISSVPDDQPESGDAGSERNAVVDLWRRRTRRQVDEVFATGSAAPGAGPLRPTPKRAGIDHVAADRLRGHWQCPIQRNVDRGAARHVGQVEGRRA